MAGWRGARGAVRVLLATGLLLSGCSVARVVHEPEADPADASRGTLVIKAIREEHPEKLAGGYVFHVSGDRGAVGSYTSDRSGPAVIPALEPGTYTVIVTGRKINPKEIRVRVRPAERTTVAFSVWNARYASLGEDFAIVTGKGLFYAGLSVLYITVYLPIRACFEFGGEDDDEDWHSPDSREYRSESYQEKKGTGKKDDEKKPDKKPEVRSLLKD